MGPTLMAAGARGEAVQRQCRGNASGVGEVIMLAVFGILLGKDLTNGNQHATREGGIFVSLT